MKPTERDYKFDAIRMTNDADLAADSAGLDRARFWDALLHLLDAGWLIVPERWTKGGGPDAA